MMMIVLTDAQANQVRERIDPRNTIAPRKLFGQGWALPVTVLLDPAYAQFVTLLSTLPQSNITSDGANWNPNSSSWYSSSWPVGQLITM